MQKLSRVDKYREYRNELNNNSESNIATKELKELQEKIIFNEKRFGNSSRTETDLQRGRKDTSFSDILSNFDYPKINNTEQIEIENTSNHSNDLDDIFNELTKYKNKTQERYDEQDDYIKRIKDVVYKTNDQHEEPKYSSDYNENDFIGKKEEPTKNEEIEFEENEEQFAQTKTYIEDLIPDDIPSQQEDVAPNVDTNDNNQNDYFAEFEEKPPIEYKSYLQDIVVEKPEVQVPVPQQDHSKQFVEICETANTLAEAIESSDSFGEDNFNKITNHSVNSSLAGVQQDIKKELINNKEDNKFMDNLQQEVEEYNKKNEEKEELPQENTDIEVTKRIIRKSEVSGQLKEEFDNTVSLEVDKLRSEINSSKADNISASEIIKSNNLYKDAATEDHPGKTIAFELNNKDEIPDNTIILSQPNIEDSSIHTMSFKTEDLDIEKEEKGNTLLNIILSILIIIAVAALGVIVYFFLITRGII